MGTIHNMVQRVNKIDLESAIPKLIDQSSFDIISLNQKQLYAGFLSTGDRIQPEYRSAAYALKKVALNPTPGYGKPDIFLTGSFYKGFGVVVKRDEYTVNSVDSKASKLELLYGSKLYGLDKANKTDYAINTLLPKIMEYIRDVAGI